MNGILSIQSQVVYGHVGNSAAQFALQTLGHEVWAVPTVLFSNHPGHGTVQGKALPATQLASLLAGLETIGAFTKLDAALSGYLGSLPQGDAVADAVAKMRSESPNALYCCDPVMGDDTTGIYVKRGLPKAIRERLVPLADIVTPNAFELRLLTGRAIKDPETAIRAARTLPVDLVICTGIPVPDNLQSLASLAVTSTDAWVVTQSRRDHPPSGTGDLFTALFLGHVLNGTAPPDAIARAASALDKILTLHSQRQTPGKDLPLVAARHHLTAAPHLRSIRKSSR